jgi:uncharacterized membrane protein YeiH
MNFLKTSLTVLELLGTVSFALSGAMTAIKKDADFFGVLFLGVLTAVGGGVFRDMLLGIFPPAAFTDKTYVGLSLVSSAVLFLIVYWHQRQYLKKEEMVDFINNIFDALGLGVFTVAGVQATQAAGYGENLFLCLFLGLITGVGGGVLRDIMVNEIPFVLKKRVYAIASLAGALVYILLDQSFPSAKIPISVFSVLLVFAIRMLSTRFRWNLPRAL